MNSVNSAPKCDACARQYLSRTADPLVCPQSMHWPRVVLDEACPHVRLAILWRQHTRMEARLHVQLKNSVQREQDSRQ